MQIHSRGSFVTKLNPAFVWPPGSGVEEEASPYEDCQPIENMNDTGSYGFYAALIYGVGCGFEAHKGGKLTSIKVWARRNGTNVDHQPLTAHIHECTTAIADAVPEGASLAASDPIDSEQIVISPDIQPIEFVFSGANQFQFTKGGIYAFAIQRDDIGSADVIRFGFYMGAAKQHPGSFSEGRTIGGWAINDPAFDLIFYVGSE